MARDEIYPGDNKPKTFTIPVSGSVVLHGPEVGVIETREFQRLAGIKQLGTSYVAFRGAVHTRFEHSLGALYQAEKMMQAIEHNPVDPRRIPVRARRLARLGALLHDIPHVPFGHTLEDEFQLLVRHDKNELRSKELLVDGSIGEVLRSRLPQGEFEELLRVLSAKDDNDFADLDFPFVGDIVGNTVCADLLDYVPRDLAACGMPGVIGDRFLDYLTLTGSDAREIDRDRLALNLDKKGMPRPDVESEVVKLLSYRYELAERVYFHHAKNAASVMIGRAVQDAGLATGTDGGDVLDRNFHWLSDELLLHALANPLIAETLKLKRARGTSPAGIALAETLARAVLTRQLFKIAYLAVRDDLADRVDRVCDGYATPTARRALEDQIAVKAGLNAGQVLIHLPRQKMMRKDADVRVRTTTGDIITLHQWDARHSRRVEALNQAHERLWRVAVYVDPDVKAAIPLVASAARDVFGPPSRYVERPPVSAYLRTVFDLHAKDRQWSHDDLLALETGPGVAAFAEGVRLEDAVNELDAKIQLLREDKKTPQPSSSTDRGSSVKGRKSATGRAGNSGRTRQRRSGPSPRTRRKG